MSCSHEVDSARALFGPDGTISSYRFEGVLPEGHSRRATEPMLPLKAICRVSWREAKEVVQSKSVEGASVDQLADALALPLQAAERIPGQLAETSQASSSRTKPLHLTNGPVSEPPDICPTPDDLPAHLRDLFKMIRVYYELQGTLSWRRWIELAFCAAALYIWSRLRTRATGSVLVCFSLLLWPGPVGSRWIQPDPDPATSRPSQIQPDQPDWFCFSCIHTHTEVSSQRICTAKSSVGKLVAKHVVNRQDLQKQLAEDSMDEVKEASCADNLRMLNWSLFSVVPVLVAKARMCEPYGPDSARPCGQTCVCRGRFLRWVRRSAAGCHAFTQEWGCWGSTCVLAEWLGLDKGKYRQVAGPIQVCKSLCPDLQQAQHFPCRFKRRKWWWRSGLPSLSLGMIVSRKRPFVEFFWSARK